MAEWTVSIGGDFTLKSSVLARWTAPVVVVEQWSAAGDAAGKPATTFCTHHIPKNIYIRSHDPESCNHSYQSFIMAPQLEQLILFDTTSRGECL